MDSPKMVIVIGTSAGGLTALQTITSSLSRDLPAAICIVQHVGQHRNYLPTLLSKSAVLPVRQAIDGERLLAGHIYVAPPDRHMLVSPGHLHLTRGPKENFARPAIDPLFRSAAEAYGDRVVGVILTGNLNDGTAGLYEVKRRGGVAVAQDPFEAENQGMPVSAIRHVAIDHVLPVRAMPALFDQLASISARAALSDAGAGENASMPTELPRERPVTLTCPECGGAMRRREVGTLLTFSCHIGHVLTADTMVAGQFLELDRALEMAFRRMNERGELCRQMAERARANGDEQVAGMWDAAQRQTHERTELIEQLLTESWQLPELDEAAD